MSALPYEALRPQVEVVKKLLKSLDCRKPGCSISGVPDGDSMGIWVVNGIGGGIGGLGIPVKSI